MTPTPTAVQNDDNGSLLTGKERLNEGDSVQINDERRVRRVTYVMGSDKKGWRACFKGQGAVPTGPVSWEKVGATNPAPAKPPPPAPLARAKIAPAQLTRKPLAHGATPTQAKPSTLVSRSKEVAIFGFDSAWSVTNRGAICGVRLGASGIVCLPPSAASFDEALELIRFFGAGCGTRLIAIDQPLVVNNEAGRRPVESLISTAIGRRGGGVQPANRSRIGMFDDAAPIWAFLSELGAELDPTKVRGSRGTFAIEVYPAAANICLFQKPKKVEPLLKYNPERATFRSDDWTTLCERLAAALTKHGLGPLAAWCTSAGAGARPGKTDQDIADSLICLLVGLTHWQGALDLPGGKVESFVLGDIDNGYMVLPTTGDFRAELAARR